MDIEAIRAARLERAQHRAARRLKWAESAEKKSVAASDTASRLGGTIPFGQPILVGHHSERGHRALLGRIDSNMRKSFENDKKAQYHRAKAENIMLFSTRVMGDAERAREQKRAELDKVIGVGSRVYDFAYGEGQVVKVNTKTYTIKWTRGGQFARDKTFVKPV